MNRLVLESNISYLIVMECEDDLKKYLYLINENDDSDIKIVELTDNYKIKLITDPILLKKIINEMTNIIYRFED